MKWSTRPKSWCCQSKTSLHVDFRKIEINFEKYQGSQRDLNYYKRGQMNILKDDFYDPSVDLLYNTLAAFNVGQLKPLAK